MHSLTTNSATANTIIKEKETENSRNGHSSKTLRTIFGDEEVAVPRDRKGEFDPQLLKKNQTSISQDVEEKILSMYAKGMTQGCSRCDHQFSRVSRGSAAAFEQNCHRRMPRRFRLKIPCSGIPDQIRCIWILVVMVASVSQVLFRVYWGFQSITNAFSSCLMD